MINRCFKEENGPVLLKVKSKLKVIITLLRGLTGVLREFYRYDASQRVFRFLLDLLGARYDNARVQM